MPEAIQFPDDVRTWTVFYRDKNARQKRLALGRYPAVKLVDARELARATGEPFFTLGNADGRPRLPFREQIRIQLPLIFLANDLLAVLNGPLTAFARWFRAFSPSRRSSAWFRRRPIRSSV